MTNQDADGGHRRSRRTPATKIFALSQKAAIEQRTTNNEQRSFLCVFCVKQRKTRQVCHSYL